MPNPCHICGEETAEHTAAECMRCGQVFHLALRIDVPTRECGQVWIDDDTMALDFACDICLGTVPAIPAGSSQETRPRGRRRYIRREGGAAAYVRGRKT